VIDWDSFFFDCEFIETLLLIVPDNLTGGERVIDP